MSDDLFAKRRRYPRVAVEIPAVLSVLIPEQTFQPIIHEAYVCDLSERGALVKVRLVDEVYRQLLQKTRYCRLQIKNAPEVPEKVIGTAVWIKPELVHGIRQYRIGLHFEDCPDIIAEQLREFVQRLADDEGILPETP